MVQEIRIYFGCFLTGKNKADIDPPPPLITHTHTHTHTPYTGIYIGTVVDGIMV